MKAQSLFNFYSEKQLRGFYQEFCLMKPSEVKEYIEILPGGEITFHAAKMEGSIYVHDLREIFRSLDLVKGHGGLDVCVEAKKNFGKWLHPKFLEAIDCAVACHRNMK